MVLFEFFQMMGFLAIMGFIGIWLGSAIIGEVAELTADNIRQKAYNQAMKEGLNHEEAVKRMNERCPCILAEDVRANLLAIGMVVGIVMLFMAL